VDQVFLASMGVGTLNHISGAASAIVDSLNLRPAMAETVENGPASGASAIKLRHGAGNRR
jgi:acetyl-CoA C-acetyltransferase